MKKDVSTWIEKELKRLDREGAGENPEESEENPVPDALRQALGKSPDKGPPEQK